MHLRTPQSLSTVAVHEDELGREAGLVIPCDNQKFNAYVFSPSYMRKESNDPNILLIAATDNSDDALAAINAFHNPAV